MTQRSDPADMIVVVVGGEDRRELEVFGREICEHGVRIPGIDDDGTGAIADAPDIVVLKAWIGIT